MGADRGGQPGTAADPATGWLRPTRGQRWANVRSLLLSFLVTVLLLVAYYAAPFDRDVTAEWLVLVGASLAGAVSLVVWEVRRIVQADRPVIRAVQTLAIIVPLFLLVTAVTYFLLALRDPGAFSEPLTRTDALYFTVTVFATVGFGDITPTSELARILVTGQMLLDLVLIGFVLKVLLGAAKLGLERARAAQAPSSD